MLMAGEAPRVDGLCVGVCGKILPCRRVTTPAPRVVAQFLHEASAGVAVDRDGTKGSLVSKNNYVYDFSSQSACKSTHYFVNTKTLSEKSDQREPSPLILILTVPVMLFQKPTRRLLGRFLRLSYSSLLIEK